VLPLPRSPSGVCPRRWERIRAAEPPDVSTLDEDLGGIVLRCLRRLPAHRFGSAGDLRRALAAARQRRSLPVVGTPELAAWVETVRS
jgi:hypothetical protein